MFLASLFLSLCLPPPSQINIYGSSGEAKKTGKRQVGSSPFSLPFLPSFCVGRGSGEEAWTQQEGLCVSGAQAVSPAPAGRKLCLKPFLQLRVPVNYTRPVTSMCYLYIFFLLKMLNEAN